MKKCFTLPTLRTFSVLPTKIFLIVLLLCCISISSYATAWTTGTAGDVTLLSNWTNGTTSPTSFTTPGDTWTINLAMTETSSANWTVGTAASTAVTVTFATGGTLSISGAGGVSNDTVYGGVVINGGTLNLGGAGTTEFFNVYGNVTFTTGTISSTGATSLFTLNVNGNYTMTGGTATTAGAAGGTITTNVHGNFSDAGGVYNSGGSSCVITNNIYGNCSYSGASAMTSTGAGATCVVHLSLPTTSGTMLIDNTSTAVWSGTDVYVDAGCTAQLDGNFGIPSPGLSSVSSAAYGFAVNGTLICPAAYTVPAGAGTAHGFFKVNVAATLEVANTLGIDGNITTPGTKTFNTAANYVFNGTAAQVTGSLLPVALVSPDTVTISNPAGVTLTQSVATTGTLLFTSGILYTTSSNTMTTPGVVGAVVGAGATSYVDGALVKTIPGLTSVNYEVGDLDYAPMLLTFSAAGTTGSLGVMSTNGLHPSVGTSGLLTTNMVNHYWTITDYASGGPATVNVKGTYNLSDITGGSNASFMTQEYTGSAWLPSPLATTNVTSSPYSSAENPGIALATLPGDYIFGSNCTTPVITGSNTVCIGSATHLSDAGSGGTWSSSNTGIATVDASGNVYGVAAGAATISYTIGCPATLAITVGTLPITGTTTICSGSSSPLSDATAGGVWSSSNTNIATVSASGVVYGVATGSANILYTLGSCTPASVSVSVVTLTAISGNANTCVGSNTILSDGASGGVWSSSNTSIATISGGGVVSGVSAGTVTISYVVGSCSMTTTVIVGTLPITGTTTICTGSTTNLSDATAGGVWSSSNTMIATVSGAGVVTGVSNGTATISYTFGSCTPAIITVNVTTLAAITPATLTVCAGSTATLSDATTGGAWTSSNTTIATVSGGAVTGVGAGTTTIIYTLGSCTTSATVTVSGVLSPITGGTAVCAGSTLALSDATGGGVWSSSNTSVATISGAGVVYGITAGTTNISYTTGSCSVGITVTVDAVLPPITGSTTVCAGSTITLSDATGGGVWSSNSTAIATVSGSGVVTGVTAGGATISYTVGACSVSIVITVGNSIPAISGVTHFCVTSSTILSDATPGGVWSSSNTTVATVSGAVVVHGVSAGTATISYTEGGCSVTATVIIDPNNGGTIKGRDTVCVGSPITLSDAQTGGVWSSSNSARATVNASTGVVTGVTSGTVTISYVVTNTCGTYTATVVVRVFTAAACPTGIEPVTAEPAVALKVFPNPNGGTFTMELVSDDNEEVHVVMTNVIGEKVSEFITATNKITDIRLAPASGIYLLSASTAHGRYIAKVVIN